MKKKIIDKLINLNTYFYNQVEKDFDTTRQYPWNGWKRVGDIIKNQYEEKALSYLDLACGNGRFACYLQERNFPVLAYLGLDNSEFLLRKARELNLGENFKFDYLDLLKQPLLNKKFDVIVSFGFLHHLPSQDFRIEFINNLIEKLDWNGLLIITLWSGYKKKSFKPVDDLSLEAKSLLPFFEKGDHFLGWNNKPNLERYCHLFEQEEIEKFIPQLQNCKLVDLYRSDGKANSDNFYLALKKSSNQNPHTQGLST